MQNGGLRPNLPGSDQQTINAAMLMATRTNPMLAVLFMFFSFCIGIFSFIVKPLLRKNLGERSFGFLTILLCFLALRLFYIYDVYGRLPQHWNDRIPGWFFRIDLAGITPDNRKTIDLTNGVSAPLGGRHKPEFPSPVGIYGYIVLAFGMAEFLNAWNRRQKKLRIHSHYRGESRFLSFLAGQSYAGITITDTVIRAFLEPALVLLLGAILFIIGDYYFGAALLFGSGALILEEYLFYIKRRQMLLDIIDNEIDGEYLMSAKEQYQKHPETFRTHEILSHDPIVSRATMD